MRVNKKCSHTNKLLIGMGISSAHYGNQDCHMPGGNYGKQ